MRITVFDRGNQIHLSTRRYDPPAGPLSGSSAPPFAVNAFADEWQAIAFVRRHFADPYLAGRLREALAADGYDVVRDMDDDILRVAGRLIASGIWTLSGAQPGAAMESVIVATGPRGIAVERSSPQRGTRRENVPAAAPSGKGKTVAQEAQNSIADMADWPKFWDQLAQAITLERAARNRTPFCAICAELAKAKTEGKQA